MYIPRALKAIHMLDFTSQQFHHLKEAFAFFFLSFYASVLAIVITRGIMPSIHLSVCPPLCHSLVNAISKEMVEKLAQIG